VPTPPAFPPPNSKKRAWKAECPEPSQWLTRKPPNIDFDGINCNRFSKERKRRHIRCDACQKDCKGNDKGDFVDSDCRAGREDREVLWKHGLLDATWVCVSCKPDSSMFFKQRIRKLKKAEYKKVASTTFFKHRARRLKKSLSAATGHRTSTATGQ
jgi:hypothetical protein